MMSQLGVITIPLGPPYPESGIAAVIARMTHKDKQIFETAAAHMGMSRTVLIRLLVVRGSERILRELGVDIPYEPSGERIVS
jgi:hypothetical protein